MLCLSCRSAMRQSARTFLPDCGQIRGYRPKGAKGKKPRQTPIRVPKSAKLPPLLPRPFLASQETINQSLQQLGGRPGSSVMTWTHSKGWYVPAVIDKSYIDGIIDIAGLEEFKGKTILEMNPGPGMLAERLIERVKPKRYVALEPRRVFAHALDSLKTLVPEDQDTEVLVRQANGFDWSAFSDLQVEGVFKAEDLSHDHSKLNPNLIFISMPRASQSEQLIAQWLDTLGTRSWLQQWGRVRMFLFVPLVMRHRLLAPVGSVIRSKLTFVREATCEIREIGHCPFVPNPLRDGRKSYQEHFDIQPHNEDSIKALPDHYYPSTALSLLEIRPHAEITVKSSWDTFDFITKTLMMNKVTPLHRQIRAIASGAYALLAQLPAELRSKCPQHMTVEEMDTIALAFDAWPFKPRFYNNVMPELADNQRSKTYGPIIRSYGNVDGVEEEFLADLEEDEPTQPADQASLDSRPS